jgi:hypothetical protein
MVAAEGQKIQAVQEMLKLARQMEESARQYNGWANECSARRLGIQKLFEAVADEERHFDSTTPSWRTWPGSARYLAPAIDQAVAAAGSRPIESTAVPLFHLSSAIQLVRRLRPVKEGASR